MGNDDFVKEVNTTPEMTQERIREKRRKQLSSAVAKSNKVLERLKVEKVPVGMLKPNSYNPNRQSPEDFELLCKSMEEDGFTQPILALKDGVIVDGEHRWRAAQKLGYEEVPVVFVEMTPEQMRIATLRHNRARGSEDLQLTSQMLRDLERLGALEYVKDELMIDDKDLKYLLQDVAAPDVLASSEFSESWIPTSATYNSETKELTEDMVSVAASETLTKDKVPLIKSVSQKAAEVNVELDRKILEAKDAVEADRIRRSYSVYRVVVGFRKEEAEFVSRVLGKNPSERLFAFCKKRWDAMPDEEKYAKEKRGKKEENND